MELTNLRKLFIHELRDLHSAESQILEALPKMIEKTKDQELRSAFEQHLDQTKTHVDRLEKVFDDMGEKVNNQHCRGMEGLIEEGEEILQEDADEDVRDAGIISAAQRVEHYEMAGYGTAVTYAQMLDEDEAADLLRQTLDEEKSTDRELTKIAERTANPKAKAKA